MTYTLSIRGTMCCRKRCGAIFNVRNLNMCMLSRADSWFMLCRQSMSGCRAGCLRSRRAGKLPAMPLQLQMTLRHSSVRP